mgnify:CR=1 FL=1
MLQIGREKKLSEKKTKISSYARPICMKRVPLEQERVQWTKYLYPEHANKPHMFYSIVWRIHLGELRAGETDTWSTTTLLQRRAYHHLCTKYAKAWDEVCRLGDHNDVHPLQDVGKTLWQKRTDMEDLRALIDLDVQRLGVPLNEEDQQCLARILRVWSFTHVNLGYFQGMHELGALLWRIRDSESASVPENSVLRVLLSPSDVEPDTYFLFSALIQRLTPLYDRTQRAGSPTLIKAILHRVDPPLYGHLQSLQLEWAPILLRWHRLLYMQEFSETAVLELWDTLFAIDHTLQLVPYISAAILLSQRDKIIQSDYIDAMQFLMHLPDLKAPRQLVEHAMQLCQTPSASVGAFIARAYEQHPPPEPTESKMESAKNMLRDLAAGILTPEGHGQPVWSPRAEDRLHSESSNYTEQHKRAMLSLDSAHEFY